LEETLLRSAPEALLRRFVSSSLPTTGRFKRGSSWVAASGGAAPKGTIDHGDHTERVDISPDDPENVTPFDQLVVRDAGNVEHHLRLSPKMSAESLRRKIADVDPPTGQPLYLHSCDENHDTYIALLGQLYPDSPYTPGATLEAGVHRVHGRTEFRFSTDYYRAVAKIAFHYFLVVNRRRLIGDEPEFEPMRRFIVDGGDPSQFFDVGGARFATPMRELPDGSAILSSRWAHGLAADEESGSVTVHVMLFAGPKHLPRGHHVNIATLASKLVVPNAQHAHQYIYHDEPDEDGFSGIVVEATVSRVG
jgi:hypothetical protein